METILLMVAALIAFAGAIFHGFVGGKIYMSNIFLLVSGATLLCVAMSPELALLSYPILLGNVMGAVLFLWLGLTGHGALIKLPGMYLMFVTAVLGWSGLP